MLVEASQPGGGVAPRPTLGAAAAVTARPPPGRARVRPCAAVLSVCRSAVRLLAHVGSVDAPLLRGLLCGGEFKAQLLHLVHLALDLSEDANIRGGGGGGGGGGGIGGGGGGSGGGGGGGGGGMGEERVGSAEEVGSLLHELLLVLGIFVHGSRANAELLRWRCGERPTMLQRLVSLPFRYWCVPALRRVLLPTLLCGCLHDPTNTQILSASLHPAHLVRFLEEETESAGDSPSGATPAAVLLPDPSELPIVNMDYALSARLPREEWAGAIAFFSRQPASPSSTASSPPPARSVDGEDCPSALCLAQQAA